MIRSVLACLAGLVLVGGCNGTPSTDADSDTGDASDDLADADTTPDGSYDPGDAVDVEIGPDDADASIPDVVWWTPDSTCGEVAADPPAWVAPSCGEGCRQVAFAAQPRGLYAASDRWLVYRGARHTWFVDLATGEESVLFCHPTFVGSYGLAIDDDVAVYALETNFPVDGAEYDYAAIWAADFRSDRQWEVARWVKPWPSEWTGFYEVALSGRRAAATIAPGEKPTVDTWLDRMDVIWADIDTGLVSNVTNLGWPCCLGWPDISGDWIVYSTTAEVFAYDIASGATIGRDIPGDQYWPRVDGRNVIWLDHRNYPGGYTRGGSWDIYSYNLDSGTELQITTVAPVPESAAPDLLGDVVVWSDDRAATSDDPYHRDLYVYRYSTGAEQQITFNAGKAVYPQLNSDTVFFDWTPVPDDSPATPDDHALCAQTLPVP